MKIDRRLLYLVSVALVAVTIFMPLGLPVKVSPLAIQTYDAIQNLPDNSVVLIAPMYDPGAAGELNPMLRAILYQCMERKYRIILGNTSWTLGVAIAHDMITPIAAEFNYVYGTDYIEFGSKPGGPVWMQSAKTDLAGAAIVDYNNDPIGQFPLIQAVPRLTQEYIAAVLVLDCGTPGALEWLQIITQGTSIQLIVGEIQMSVPDSMTYVQSGQYNGMIAGSRGGAEYEQLVGRPGAALKSQDTMSVIALMVALFIVLGNIGYITRKK